MNMTRFRWRAAAALFLVLPACSSTGEAPLETDADAVAYGRTIALNNCATCHAIDDERASPNAAAPPLLSILLRYDSEALANDLIEGVRVGHDEMPQFDFTVREADALIAYLKAIEHTPRAAER